MNFLGLATHSAHIEEIWQSIRCLGHHVDLKRYDDIPLERKHDELIGTAKIMAPDVIVYMGGIERGPEIRTFKALREIAPMIHIAGDASDPPWFPLLEEYHLEGCFSVQVNVDGNINTPISRYGLVLLTPIDPGVCVPKPWNDRTLNCTFVGNTSRQDTPKSKILWEASDSGVVRLYHYDHDPFNQMMAIMRDSKATFNVAYMGPGMDRFNVKGRVVEAAVAGSCLLETMGSTTRYWFEPNKDYIEYNSVSGIRDLFKYFTAERADRFRTKFLREHHPVVFWSKVLWRAGVR